MIMSMLICLISGNRAISGTVSQWRIQNFPIGGAGDAEGVET